MRREVLSTVTLRDIRLLCAEDRKTTRATHRPNELGVTFFYWCVQRAFGAGLVIDRGLRAVWSVRSRKKLTVALCGKWRACAVPTSIE